MVPRVPGILSTTRRITALLGLGHGITRQHDTGAIGNRDINDRKHENAEDVTLNGL